MSGRGITGGGSGYAALLAHAGGALYGTELGLVTFKRIGFFCFPIKHSTHTAATRVAAFVHRSDLFVWLAVLEGIISAVSLHPA